MTRSARPRLAHALALTALVACGDKATDTGAADGPDDSGGAVAAGTCVSGTHWTGGNAESPRMHPGMDCIACHDAMNEGPRFTVAGTVFTNVDEPDDCNGVEDVVVEITDATGAVWTEDTNSAGNFSIRDSAMMFPITARILDGDAVREMGTAVETGACGSCHTQGGEGGAPGRVMAP